MALVMQTALRKSNGSSNVVDTHCDVLRTAFLPECCSLIGQITARSVFLYVRGNCHGLEYHQKFAKKYQKVLIPITPVAFTANRKTYYRPFVFYVDRTTLAGLVLYSTKWLDTVRFMAQCSNTSPGRGPEAVHQYTYKDEISSTKILDNPLNILSIFKRPWMGFSVPPFLDHFGFCFPR